MTMVESRPAGRSADISLAEGLTSDPLGYFETSAPAMHQLERRVLEAGQLEGLRMRFAALRDRLPMLKKLCDEQGVTEVNQLDDVVPLLFPHTVYKSYPVSLLEKNRFAQLTQWLAKLTSIDLSGVDVSACTGIDEWIAALDAQSELEVRHSSGTSGTMSFIPRSKAEAELGMHLGVLGPFQANGLTPPLPDAPLHMHVVHSNYRKGSSAHLRSADYLFRFVSGGDDQKFHTLYPGAQSADVMFLAGRINAAAAKGELERLELSPALLARKAEFETMQRGMAAKQEAFLAEMAANLKGELVYMQGTWNVLYKLAKAGLEDGVEAVFAPSSVIRTGGGAKGQTIPDDWEAQVTRYLGVKQLHHTYAMTELMGGNRLCEHERFHIEPFIILFVLDPDTGAPLPRHGVQTGRAAFFDLLAGTYWGGFVSGDEITVDWSPCACGRHSPHIARRIERYSDKRGGDDKISCAASPEAHENALQYLNSAAD
jgi:hypothetical protein